MWFEEAHIVGNLVLSADELPRVDLLTHLKLVFEVHNVLSTAQCAPQCKFPILHKYLKGG